MDAVRFTSLLNRSRQATAVQDWTSARVFVTEGLALWRGAAYAEFAGSEFATAEARLWSSGWWRRRPAPDAGSRRYGQMISG